MFREISCQHESILPLNTLWDESDQPLFVAFKVCGTHRQAFASLAPHGFHCHGMIGSSCQEGSRKCHDLHRLLFDDSRLTSE
jgi:hypothetical protein